MKNYELIAWLMDAPAGAELLLKDSDAYYRISLEDSCFDGDSCNIEIEKED